MSRGEVPFLGGGMMPKYGRRTERGDDLGNGMVAVTKDDYIRLLVLDAQREKGQYCCPICDRHVT